MTGQLTERERERYARQLVLPELGEAGQRRLKAARVLIVGAGGLGSSAALLLAAAGVGRIGIVDDDAVSLSNLQRQLLYSEGEIGRPKVKSAKARLAGLNADITIEAFAERFRLDSGRRIAAGYDLIVDGSDTHETRYAINAVCLELGLPYVYGAVSRFEGQASLLCAPDGPCYRCLFPEPPRPETPPRAEEAGILGTVPALIGAIEATEAITWIAGIGSLLVGRLLVYDALAMRFDEIAIERDPGCPACGGEPKRGDRRPRGARRAP